LLELVFGQLLGSDCDFLLGVASCSLWKMRPENSAMLNDRTPPERLSTPVRAVSRTRMIRSARNGMAKSYVSIAEAPFTDSQAVKFRRANRRFESPLPQILPHPLPRQLTHEHQNHHCDAHYHPVRTERCFHHTELHMRQRKSTKGGPSALGVADSSSSLGPAAHENGVLDAEFAIGTDVNRSATS
jgi:hypothetical protein